MLLKTIATAFLLADALVIGNNLQICKVSHGNESSVLLSVTTAKSASGDNDVDTSKPWRMKMEHSTHICGQVEYYCISGGLKGEALKWTRMCPPCPNAIPTKPPEPIAPIVVHRKRLLFHPNRGKFMNVVEDSRAVVRHGPHSGFGMALTNRPLDINEIFEVVVYFGTYPYPKIGVTAHSPSTLNYPDYMYKLNPGTWLWDIKLRKVFHNGVVLRENYGPSEFPQGGRIGVAVKDGGALHCFFNGIDQGYVVHVQSKEVYGFIEYHYAGTKAIIAS